MSTGIRGATTLADFGRNSPRFEQIPFYYAFPFRFYFGENQLLPEDVLTWCRANASGYYKIACYTHEKSKRDESGNYVEKYVYVDKIYLQSDDDATLIKMTFDVKETKVMRPKMPRKNKPRTIK